MDFQQVAKLIEVVPDFGERRASSCWKGKRVPVVQSIPGYCNYCDAKDY